MRRPGQVVKPLRVFGVADDRRTVYLIAKVDFLARHGDDGDEVAREFLRAFQHILAADLGPHDLRLADLARPRGLEAGGDVFNNLTALKLPDRPFLVFLPEILCDNHAVGGEPLQAGAAVVRHVLGRFVGISFLEGFPVHQLGYETIFRVPARRLTRERVEIHRKRVVDTFNQDFLIKGVTGAVISADAERPETASGGLFSSTFIHTGRAGRMFDLAHKSFIDFRHLDR